MTLTLVTLSAVETFLTGEILVTDLVVFVEEGGLLPEGCLVSSMMRLVVVVIVVEGGVLLLATTGAAVVAMGTVDWG